jgi:hypothetical protein
MAEHTLSTDEKGRLPDIAENETLEALTSAVIPNYMSTPILADVDRIVTSANWADGALTVAAHPDVPRNLTVTVTDADTSITGGLLTLVGKDAMGRVITEVMDLSEGLEWVGEKIFGEVTSATISATAGTPEAGVDVVTVGVGNVIGTCVDLENESEVVHVYVDNTKVTPDAIATGVSTSGIDANGATYNGSKVMWCLLRPAKNV